MYPDFLGIGAQKAGTSWLHSVLSAQNEIWLPPLKEIHYFDRKFPVLNSEGGPDVSTNAKNNSGRGFRKRLRRLDMGKARSYLSGLTIAKMRWELRYYLGRRDDDWYGSLFDMGEGKITGDMTPAYSRLNDDAVRYVHRLLPQAKVIFLLRNPIDRAWSQAVMDLTKFRNRTVDQVKDDEFLKHFGSTASQLRGSYSETIMRWRGFYSDAQFFVGFFDDISLAPSSLITQIAHFVGVTGTINVPAELARKKVNPSAGAAMAMPERFRSVLCKQYLPELEKLASDYGGFALDWLERAKSI